MVVDLARFLPHQELSPGLLWVVEQVCGCWLQGAHFNVLTAGPQSPPTQIPGQVTALTLPQVTFQAHMTSPPILLHAAAARPGDGG